MSDIFISYSRHDNQRVEALAAILEQAGWSVWWDRHIKGGNSFDKLIEEQIQKAKAVVVVWSHDSVHSDWVRAEAAFALERNKLVPVRLDECLPPLRFTHVQTEDISGWDGSAARSDAMRKLLADLSALIGAPANTGALGAAGAAGRAARPRWQQRPVFAVIAALLLGGGAVLAWRVGPWSASRSLPAAPIVPAQPGAPLPATPLLDILDQDMVAVRDAPVRVAPQIAAQQVGMLAAGRTVHVAGRVRDSAWYALQSPGATPSDGNALTYVASAALVDTATYRPQQVKSAQPAKPAATVTQVATQVPPPTAVPATAPVVIAAATVPAEPASSAPSGAGFDGAWTGYIQCTATRNLPAATNDGYTIEIVAGQIAGEVPLNAAGPNAHGNYRGRVFPNGAVNINGTVSNARMGNYNVAFRGRIEGNLMRAAGFVGNRQCQLNYTRRQ